MNNAASRSTSASNWQETEGNIIWLYHRLRNILVTCANLINCHLFRAFRCHCLPNSYHSSPSSTLFFNYFHLLCFLVRQHFDHKASNFIWYFKCLQGWPVINSKIMRIQFLINFIVKCNMTRFFTISGRKVSVVSSHIL